MGSNKNTSVVRIYLLSGKSSLKIDYMGISFEVPLPYSIIRRLIERGYISFSFPIVSWKERLREKIGDEELFQKLYEHITYHLALSILRNLHDIIPPKVYAFYIETTKAPYRIRKQKEPVSIFRGKHLWVIVERSGPQTKIVIVPTNRELFRQLLVECDDETLKLLKTVQKLAKKVGEEELESYMEEALKFVKTVNMISES